MIVDTFNRSAPGKDENSSKDMGEVLAGMKHLQHLMGGLVLVVHHTGKDASKGMRGHSSLHAALDGAIEVRKTNGVNEWSTAKVKDGPDNLVVPFKLHVVELGVDEDGDPVTSCVAGPDAAGFIRARPLPRGHVGEVYKLIAADRRSSTGITFEDMVALGVAEFSHEESKKRPGRARRAIQNLIDNRHFKETATDGEYTIS